MKKIINSIIFFIICISNTNADLKLMEILPNTTDDKNLEYIELYNTSSSNLIIENYYIKDKSDKKYIFELGENIDGLSSKKFLRTLTKIILNNSSEDLFLYDNNDNLIDSFSYSSSIKGDIIVIYNNGEINHEDKIVDQENIVEEYSSSSNGGSVQTSNNTDDIIDFFSDNQKKQIIEDLEIQDVEIIIESGLNNLNECINKNNCNINFKYNGSDLKVKCKWDFGEGIPKPGHNQKCNPSHVSYGFGNFEVTLKVIDRNNINNFEESKMFFSNKSKEIIKDEEKINEKLEEKIDIQIIEEEIEIDNNKLKIPQVVKNKIQKKIKNKTKKKTVANKKNVPKKEVIQSEDIKIEKDSKNEVDTLNNVKNLNSNNHIEILLYILIFLVAINFVFNLLKEFKDQKEE